MHVNKCQILKWFKDSPYLFQKAFDTDVDNDVLSTDQAVDKFNSKIPTSIPSLL